LNDGFRDRGDDGMGEARNVVERFYQQFGAGDMTEAFACFDPECIASDGEMYVTGRFKGTHRNDLATPLGTIVASDHPLDLFFTDYFRVASGKIVECEAVWDRLSIVAQLGASIGADVGHLPALLSTGLTGAGEPPGPENGA
jgi:ketosteroid isomerase-like protein